MKLIDEITDDLIDYINYLKNEYPTQSTKYSSNIEYAKGVEAKIEKLKILTKYNTEVKVSERCRCVKCGKAITDYDSYRDQVVNNGDWNHYVELCNKCSEAFASMVNEWLDTQEVDDESC